MENAKTTAIKFFYNGLKVNGEKKLIKCFYSLDNSHDGRKCVTIYAREYSNLNDVRDIFVVENNSDSYTDYFEDDSTDIFPNHPLYLYARSAAVKSALKDARKHLEYITSRANKSIRLAEMYSSDIENMSIKIDRLEEELATLPKGHPTSADIEAVHNMRIAEENEKIEAEKERQKKAQEDALREQNEGRKYIEEIAEQYPIKNGEPVVTINWSEHPAFYSWNDGELKLSLPAADIILKHFDEERHAKNQIEGHGGYDKTSFVIEYTDTSGDSSSYDGRYDLGDNDSGLIGHIRAFAECYRNPKMYGYSEEKAAEIESVADLLEKYTVQNQAGGHTDSQIISVSFAPWFEDSLEKIAEEQKKEFDDIVDMLDIMTDDQLISAIMSFPPNCSDVELCAVRLIIQRLAIRDQKKALEVFCAWKNGERR